MICVYCDIAHKGVEFDLEVCNTCLKFWCIWFLLCQLLWLGGAGYRSVFWSICVQRGPITDRSVSIDGVSGRNKFPRAAAQNMYHLSRKI